MNFEQLLYIKNVLEHKSITIAAQKLFVSQSAISQAITALEKELQIKLFQRSRQGTIPTEDGKWMLPKLMEIYQKTVDIKQEVKNRQSDLFGNLVIATVPGVFMTILPKTFAKFKNIHPRINYKIFESDNPKVIERVLNKEVDLGFIAKSDEINEEILHVRTLPISSNYYLIVNTHSPYALFQQISLKDLDNTSFIVYGYEYFANLMHRFSEREPHILFSSYNSEVIKKSVIEGLGVSILSDLMLKDDPYIAGGQLKAIKLVDSPFDTPVTYSLIYRKDCPNKMIVEKLISFLKVD